MPGPVVLDVERHEAPSSTPARDRHGRPGGVWTSAFSTSARPTWSTRCSSRERPDRRGSAARRRALPAALGERRELLAERRARPRASSTVSRSTRSRPASSRERSSRSVGELRQPVDLLAHRRQELRRASPRRASSSSSSSRKPPSEKSGVRSSCDAFAMNSLRARVELREPHAHPVERGGELRRPRRRRRRRSARRSCPSAIRSAARSSRRIRRARIPAAPASRAPRATRSASRRASRSRRLTTRTVAS